MNKIELAESEEAYKYLFNEEDLLPFQIIEKALERLNRDNEGIKMEVGGPTS